MGCNRTFLIILSIVMLVSGILSLTASSRSLRQIHSNDYANRDNIQYGFLLSSAILSAISIILGLGGIIYGAMSGSDIGYGMNKLLD